jgi:hypothetical protein
MTTWQDIATAPRDGTAVLATHAVWEYPVVSLFYTHWMSWQDALNGYGLSPQPSHWMPLPEPPK